MYLTTQGHCGCNRNGGYPHGTDWRMVTVSGGPGSQIVGFTTDGAPIVVGAFGDIGAGIASSVQSASNAATAASNAARTRSSVAPMVIGGLLLLGLGALFFASPKKGRNAPATVGGARTRTRRKAQVKKAVTKARATAKRHGINTKANPYPSVSGARPTRAAKKKTGKKKAGSRS